MYYENREERSLGMIDLEEVSKTFLIEWIVGILQLGYFNIQQFLQFKMINIRLIAI